MTPLQISQDEAADHLGAIERHHEQIQNQKNLAYIRIDDPVEQESKRQRAIIDLALIALGRGDKDTIRVLLGEL